MTRYGSIIGSPPDEENPLTRTNTGPAPSLRLPGPAINSEVTNNSSNGAPGPPSLGRNSVSSIPEHGAQPKTRHETLAPRHFSIFRPKRVNSTPGPPPSSIRRPLTRRVLSLRHGRTAQPDTPDAIALDAYREVDARQAEFFMFLDKEFEKIQDFYKQKEDEATSRLRVLRDQLHIMRDRRLDEVMRKNRYFSQSSGQNGAKKPSEGEPLLPGNMDHKKSSWLDPVDRALGRDKAARVGKTFQAMAHLGTPPGPVAMDAHRDYIRRPQGHDVQYRAAKHKLKIALAEYYRGLELLKSYALLNRTAFRKINKKFDKAVNARPSGRYMAEKVNEAHFVNSEIVDGHIHAVEDLYARYFERGSRKIAVGKLRAKVGRTGEYSANTFRSGVLLAMGLVFSILGLVRAVDLLSHENPTVVLETSYLLQVRMLVTFL